VNTDTQGSADLAGLLATGERAAFHGRPADAISALEQAVVLAQKQGRRAEVTAAAWLLGVALGAGGRYGGALMVLSPLIEGGESPDQPADQRLFSALAAATVASVHRQLGRHAAARETDLRGLALTDGTGEAAFDCKLGLAADAVGLGESEAATAALAEAAGLVPGRDDWWRQRVRLDWVRAEVALLEGNAAQAVESAEAAVAGAEEARAPRHVAKGLLFLGVAQLHTGSPESATSTLRRAATLAEGLATLPLVWPSRALLGALLADTDVDESDRSLAAARNAVLAIAGDLPPNVREEWLTRPDIAELLGA
jgi:tetratricopeptide (TPR) repeat protein